jgi:hypothetical protein
MQGPEIEAKGQSFYSVLAAFEELRGPALVSAVKQKVDGEFGEALRYGSLLPSGWYPVAWYRELFRTGAALAPDVLNMGREAGRLSGAREIRGIYKVVFRALSTETIALQAPRLFKLFYNGGKVEVLESNKKFARVQYRECYGFDRFLWQDLLGGAESIFAATGAKDLRIRIEDGGGNGDHHMLTTAAWE